ncbi:MFS transporter [Rhodoplanes sp. TEM]|uniref:MFS transporter n=1 Tax=Rhodoplanes tepidamans TaxID=200616 RepID=A0ABT5JGN2_RHOTP|nr:MULTISPECIES: MFS transporter [Rhodoplanes]MDC7788866.1 MFS transporter [Rhodoplanes tepidamans]MDC7986703.1 MFS transporter [Rhodoplanes sp. TEM]MDQ0357843.1 putative MFS family arabinose efflux permease [Rhodoplanes tepidamans]
MTARARLLLALTILSAFNQLDRQLTAILLEPIRREFALSDVELGLLSGLAFAVLYAGLSLPAAIWAMHYGRRTLVAVSAAVWGLATIASGLAQSFGQLLLGRIGIGAGEAGVTPAAHAMISDSYPPHERASAMATWSSGVNIGVFLAFLVGSYVGHRYGWRTAFVACGVATVLAAIAVRIGVAEPPRTRDRETEALRGIPSLGLLALTVRIMWRDPALRHTVIGATITATVGYGAISWVPSFLVRVHGLDLATTGTYLALVIGVGGATVVTLGGRLADRLHRHGIGWSLGAIGLWLLIVKPFALVFYLTSSTAVALTVFVLPATAANAYLGPALAVLHGGVPPTLRPAASAVFLIAVNLIGLGVGPLIVGALSQWVFADAGPRSLGNALALMQALGAWGALHVLLAARALVRRPPAPGLSVRPDPRAGP